MRHPLRLVIQVPLRTNVEHRMRLIGWQPALVIDQTKPFLGYRLLPSVKPRADAMHLLCVNIADHISAGYSVLVWDVDRVMSDLATTRSASVARRPRLAASINDAWERLTNADDEDLIDIRGFSRLPGGHYVQIIGARGFLSELESANTLLSGAARRWARRTANRQPPKSEQFWGVLHRFLLDRKESEQAWTFFQNWVRAGRPDPLYDIPDRQ